MTIIYNEETALQHKELHERAVRIFNRTTTLFLVLAIGALALFAWIWIAKSHPLFLIIPGVIFIAAFAMMGLIQDGPPEPPSDVVYYSATRNKKVLCVKIKKCNIGCRTAPFVYVVTEDNAGKVEETEVCRAEYQQHTKYRQMTFNVNEGIVYVPYEKNQ